MRKSEMEIAKLQRLQDQSWAAGMKNLQSTRENGNHKAERPQYEIRMGFVPFNDPNIDILVRNHKKEQLLKREANKRRAAQETRIYPVPFEEDGEWYLYNRLIGVRRGFHPPSDWLDELQERES